MAAYEANLIANHFCERGAPYFACAAVYMTGNITAPIVTANLSLDVAALSIGRQYCGEFIEKVDAQARENSAVLPNAKPILIEVAQLCTKEKHPAQTPGTQKWPQLERVFTLLLPQEIGNVFHPVMHAHKISEFVGGAATQTSAYCLWERLYGIQFVSPHVTEEESKTAQIDEVIKLGTLGRVSLYGAIPIVQVRQKAPRHIRNVHVVEPIDSASRALPLCGSR